MRTLAQLRERIGQLLLVHPPKSSQTAFRLRLSEIGGGVSIFDDVDSFSALAVSVIKPSSNLRCRAAMLLRCWSLPWLSRHRPRDCIPVISRRLEAFCRCMASAERIMSVHGVLKCVRIGAVRPFWLRIVDTSAFAGDLPSRPAVRSGVFPGRRIARISTTSTIPSQTQTYRHLTSQGPRKLVPGPEDFAAQLDCPLALGYGFRRKLASAHGRYGTGERIESFLVVDLGKCHR